MAWRPLLVEGRGDAVRAEGGGGLGRRGGCSTPWRLRAGLDPAVLVALGSLPRDRFGRGPDGPESLSTRCTWGRVRVGGVNAVFVRERGRFGGGLARGGPVGSSGCLAALRLGGRCSGGSTRSARRAPIGGSRAPRAPLGPHPGSLCGRGRVLGRGLPTGAVGSPAATDVAAGQARLLGSGPGRAAPLLGPNPGLWPTAELLVCRDVRREGPLGYCLARREEANGLTVLAVARQRLDGTVELRAVAELPRLRSGR